MDKQGKPGLPPAKIVVGLGEILWDVLPDGRAVGGAPANFVFHTAALGAEAILVNSVGEDANGTELIRRMEEEALSTEYIYRDAQHPTGTVTVRLDESGVPDYTIHEGAAWDFIPWTDSCGELAKRAGAICCGTLAHRSPVSRRTLRRFLESVGKNTVKVVDVNLRQHYYSKELLEQLLSDADIVKLNEVEFCRISSLFFLAGTETERLERLLERFSLQLIALTKGGRGSRLKTPEKDSTLAGEEITAVDTVGAGDAFAASLVLDWIQGLDLDLIHKRADAIAATVCLNKGAWVRSKAPA